MNRMIAILGWVPILLTVPVFLAVRELVPSSNGGSIGDGFRKLNVFFSVMIPVAAICWGCSVTLQLKRDYFSGNRADKKRNQKQVGTSD